MCVGQSRLPCDAGLGCSPCLVPRGTHGPRGGDSCSDPQAGNTELLGRGQLEDNGSPEPPGQTQPAAPPDRGDSVTHSRGEKA